MSATTDPIPIPKLYREDSFSSDKTEPSPPRSLDSQKRVTFASTNTIHTFEPSDDEHQEILVIQKSSSLESMKRKWSKSDTRFQLVQFDIRKEQWKQIHLDQFLFDTVVDVVSIEDWVFCTSASGFLTLLTLRNTNDGMEFQKLDQIRLNENMGKLVRIDASKSIVAVTGFQHYIDLYHINDDLIQIVLERCIKVSGIILFMEFLNSEQFLVVVYEKQYRLRIYQLRNVPCREVAFFDLDMLPIQLIPIASRPNSFIVVTKKSIYYFDASEVSSDASFSSELVPKLKTALNWNDTNYTSLIKAYTKVPIFENGFEVLYLASKDGSIFKCTVMHCDPWLTFKKCGTSSGTIDRLSFIKRGKQADYLAVFGACSDGEIVSIERSQIFHHPAKTIPNVFPVFDIAVGDPHSEEKMVDTLYVACNEKQYGRIKEVHGMMEPQVVFSTQEYQGATKIWSFGLDVFDLISHGAEKQSDKVILLSFTNSTRLVHVMGKELVDVTEICGIQDNSTLFGGSISGESAIVQVQPERINVVLIERYGDSIKAKNAKSLNIPGCLSCAFLRSNFLFVAMGDPKAILVFRILCELDSGFLEIRQISAIDLQYEVSNMISPCLSTGDPVCILTTYEPAIQIVPLDGLKEGSVEGITDHVDQPIHFLEYVENTCGRFLVGGTRAGNVSLWIWNHTGLCMVSNICVGTFLHEMKSLDGKVVAFTKPRPVIIDVSNGNIATDFVHSVATVLDGCIFPPIEDGWLFLNKKSLTCYEATKSKRWLSDSKPVIGNPKKVVFDPQTRKLIVAVVIRDKNDQTSSQLVAVDPSTGGIVARSDVFARVVITSLLIWNVHGDGRKKKRYIVVGANKYDSHNKEMDGQVIALTLKRNKSNRYEFKRLDDLKTPESVTALCPLRNYMLITCGHECYSLYQIKIDSKKRKMLLANGILTKYKINSISVSGDYIFMVGGKSPLMAYKYESNTKELVELHTNQFPQNYTACKAFTCDGIPMVFSMHKEGIVSLYMLNDKKLDMIFTFNTTEPCCTLVSAILFPQTESNVPELARFNIPWQDKDYNVFYSVSNNGTLVAFTRVSENLSYELLSLQEGMQEFDDPLLGGSWLSFRQGSSSVVPPYHNIIDGIFLRRFLSLPYKKKEKLVEHMHEKRRRHKLSYSAVPRGEELLGSKRLDVHDFELIITRLEQTCLGSKKYK